MIHFMALISIGIHIMDNMHVIDKAALKTVGQTAMKVLYTEEQLII